MFRFPSNCISVTPPHSPCFLHLMVFSVPMYLALSNFLLFYFWMYLALSNFLLFYFWMYFALSNFLLFYFWMNIALSNFLSDFYSSWFQSDQHKSKPWHLALSARFPSVCRWIGNISFLSRWMMGPPSRLPNVKGMMMMMLVSTSMMMIFGENRVQSVGGPRSRPSQYLFDKYWIRSKSKTAILTNTKSETNPK